MTTMLTSWPKVGLRHLTIALQHISGISALEFYRAAADTAPKFIARKFDQPETGRIPETGGTIVNTDIESQIIALEQKALERWAKSDATGFLDLYAPEVSYFDPFLPKRLDGRDKIKAYYDMIQSRVKIDHFELIKPKVQHWGDTAILTYNFLSWGGNDEEFCWNCTEVFRQTPQGWRIFHSHWSFDTPTDVRVDEAVQE